MSKVEAPEALTLRLPDGAALRGLAWGDPDGKPLLCAHGWLDNAASFEGLVAALQGTIGRGWRVVAVDLPGHGLSDWRGGGVYHFIDWAPDMLGAMDALGWARCTLLGHSMGAGVMMLAAGAAPERVDRLALIDGLGPRSTPAEEAPELLLRAYRQHVRRATSAPRTFASLDEAVDRMLEVRTPMLRTSAETIARRGTEAVEEGVRFRHDPMLQMTSRLRLTEGQVAAFLARIACPTLLIRPEQGWPLPAEYARARLAPIRDLTLITTPGGHHAHMDDPDAIAPPLAAFLLGERLASSSWPEG